MSYTSTVGKILLKHNSPSDLHAFIDSKELDKKNIAAFFADLAEKHPDQYKQVVSDLTRLGFETATRLGSTVRLGDLLPPAFKEERFASLRKDIDNIKAQKLAGHKERDAIVDLLNKFSNDINKELVENGIKENKTLAKVVKAGARGSPAQYRQTIFSPVSVNDNKGGILTDFIIDRSFAEGLTLPQYLAHTFGSRQASAATKLAVADAGALGKQLSRAGMTVLVEMHDCGTHNGIAVKTDDKDYIGSFLAKPVDKYNYNNEVTSGMLVTLFSKGISDIIVRNPITCQASHDHNENAVCQLCIGKREKGLPALGSYIGIIAGTTLAEPLSQGMLNCLESNTYIRLSDYSLKKIKDIKIGDEVLGADENGFTFSAKVTNKFNQGYQKVYSYKFRKGSTRLFETLIATENHKILSNVKKWSCKAEADNNKLQVLPLNHIGRDFNAVKGIQHNTDYAIDDNFAYLFGLLMGDYGMWDKYAHEKIIPMEFYKWNNKSIADLIAGLIDTDGSICLSNIRGKNRLCISYSSTSKQLAQQLSDLLEWRFCIYSTNLTKVRSAGQSNSKHDQWAFTINDSTSLHNFIKYIPVKGIKKNKLNEMKQYIPEGNNTFYTLKRQRNPELIGYRQCWDIEVEHESALFVLGNGLIVHNSKHAGGSARSASSFGGFKYVNQMFNIPETFLHEAPIAEKDGVVDKIRIAPQGGHYVDIHNNDNTKSEYYVHPDLNVFAKEGSKVEEGDVLSDGIPHPAKIVKHKGIGAGRVYFSDQIKKTFENSQLGGINKRNFDTISKSLISHVRITDPKGLGNYLPDTIVNYHSLEKDYQPRPDSKKVRVDAAKGLYLEIPELHYTIGTRLTNSMIANLKHHNIDYVTVHEEGPGFEPEMQRLLDIPAHEHDWMHTLYSTHLERRLMKSVNTGASSSITGPSPVPGLAYAVGFGKNTVTEKKSEELEEALSFE